MLVFAVKLLQSELSERLDSGLTAFQSLLELVQFPSLLNNGEDLVYVAPLRRCEGQRLHLTDVQDQRSQVIDGIIKLSLGRSPTQGSSI